MFVTRPPKRPVEGWFTCRATGDYAKMALQVILAGSGDLQFDVVGMTSGREGFGEGLKRSLELPTDALRGAEFHEESHPKRFRPASFSRRWTFGPGHVICSL